jgi:erythromycin esterase-like protein
MGQRRGEINLGQLMRERYGLDQVFNIGFTSHDGHVAAADEWDSPGQRKVVRASMPGSYEAIFHDVGFPSFVLPLRDGGPTTSTAVSEVREALAGPALERAIGVIYRPRTERQSHYFYAELPQQFDLVVHIDKTSAVQPLEPAHPSWQQEHLAKEDAPETYPFAV